MLALVYQCKVDVTKKDINGKFGSDLILQNLRLLQYSQLKKIEQQIK